MKSFSSALETSVMSYSDGHCDSCTYQLYDGTERELAAIDTGRPPRNPNVAQSKALTCILQSTYLNAATDVTP